MSFAADHSTDEIGSVIATLERLGFQQIEDGNEASGKPYLIMSLPVGEADDYLDIKLSTTADDGDD